MATLAVVLTGVAACVVAVNVVAVGVDGVVVISVTVVKLHFTVLGVVMSSFARARKRKALSEALVFRLPIRSWRINAGAHSTQA